MSDTAWRARWDEILDRYGSGWAGGVAALERVFVARGTDRTLDLVMRTPPAMAVQLVLTEDGAMTHQAATLPDGPSASPTALADANAIIGAAGRRYVMSPSGSCEAVDLGADGTAAWLSVTDTRRLSDDDGDWVILYGEQDWPERRVLWVDLRTRTLGGIGCYSLPARSYRALSVADVAFLDRALRDHGDFGVYGNVQGGWDALVTHSEVGLDETETHWSVSADPRDGHGHFLRFEIDRSDGSIAGCMAGHLIPSPLPDLDLTVPEDDD